MNEHAPFSPHRNFADNLRALCIRHGSIAAVCRALGMNRQQFNKYLAGSTLPNAPTLERICSFFAIEAETLFHDPDGFRGARPEPEADPSALLSALEPASLGAVSSMLDRMRQSTLRTGCYHFYYAWPRDPSKCVRAALFVYRRGGMTLFSRFTKLRAAGSRPRYYLSGRHDGVVLESDSAKFLVAINRKGFGEVSLVSIGAEGALSQDFMCGLALAMGPSGNPLALRATLQYRGAASYLKHTIQEACILPLSAPEIPEEVRQSVSAEPQSGAASIAPFSLLDTLPLAWR
jgi:transcriptional regulator with XRE-family HTH domain